MADKNIGALPAATALDDDSLLVAEQQGEAVSLKGLLLRKFAENAAAAVKKGDPGEPGKDFQILGYYTTLDALKAAQTNPTPGDAYGVGAAAPYSVYVWDGVNLSWKDNGTIQGPTGEKGNPGAVFTPHVDGEGNLSWTNDGELENPATVNLKGPKGEAFEYEDFTEEQLAKLKGEKGDAFTYDDFTEDQLENLKGSKGDPFTYDDFTEEQLANLKGEKGDSFKYEDFTDEQLAKLVGPKGDPGNSIRSIDRTSGNGAPGTTDTYTVTLTDGSTTQFYVYNGRDGEGAGDMTAAVYDPQGKKTDVFAYVDEKLKDVDFDITADEVTFADGTTFQQKYDSGELAGPAGKDGEDGQPGADGYTPKKGVDYFDGEPGKDGEDGVSIQSVEQTTTSTEDGGTNVITVTKTDGTTSTFSVKNGSKGSDGAAGKDGAAGPAGADGTAGKDATINGVNALTLAAESPIKATQDGSTLTLGLDGDLGSSATTASATLTTSGWSSHSVLGYQQTVTVTGLTAAASLIQHDVELSTTDKDGNTAILEAYALIAANPATPGTNALTFYAESVPSVNVPVTVGWM